MFGCCVTPMVGRPGSCVVTGINTVLHVHVTCLPISITMLLSPFSEAAT